MHEIKIYREVIQRQELVVKCYSVEEANKSLSSPEIMYAKWTNSNEPEVNFLTEKTHLVKNHKTIDLFVKDIIELYSLEELLQQGYIIVDNHIEFSDSDFNIDYFKKYDLTGQKIVSIVFADYDCYISEFNIVIPNELIKKVY